MTMKTVTALAHPNIAFIKYWGNLDDSLRIPANGSISMNLDSLHTMTRVTFSKEFPSDQLFINNQPASADGLDRVVKFLDRVREIAGLGIFAEIWSENNFPTGAGIASSASAFAALSLAATRALNLELSEASLSALARRGSGSAARSIPGGFVEWLPGSGDSNSYTISFAPAEHFNLIDCIAIVQASHKEIGSSQGHVLANTSPLQAARVADAPHRLDLCRQAIIDNDFRSFAEVVELDSTLMHAIMMTSTPPLFYWEPVTIEIMKRVQGWRKEGLAVCYTIDAGPNVHILCLQKDLVETTRLLRSIEGVQQVLVAKPGGPAQLV